jgi:hypothetical protein
MKEFRKLEYLQQFVQVLPDIAQFYLKGSLPQEFANVSVSGFFGVPFAEQPIGDRRFAPPQMLRPWQDELKATTPAKTCFYTLDSAFPGFPGAEIWNAKNVTYLSRKNIPKNCINLGDGRGLPRNEHLGSTGSRWHCNGLDLRRWLLFRQSFVGYLRRVGAGGDAKNYCCQH